MARAARAYGPSDFTGGPRLYDMSDDSFIIDRAEIIDELVMIVGQIFSVSQRWASGSLRSGLKLTPEGREVLRSMSQDDLGRRIIERHVAERWRLMVDHG